MCRSLNPPHNRSVSTAHAAQPPSPFAVALRQFGDRLFEAAPGLTTWILLLAPAWISIIFHSTGALIVAGVVLVYDVYWLFRAVTVVGGIYSTMHRMRLDMKKDWLAICVEEGEQGQSDPLQYTHLCVIPTYTEPYHVLERTVQAIADANYPAHLKMIGIITRETDLPGLGERRSTQGEVRRPPWRVLPHQGSTRAGNRGRKVRSDELGWSLDGARADRARSRPQQGADHRPGFGLSRPPRVFRLDQLSPCPRAAAGLCDLAAGASLPQQHLAGADGGAGDVGDHVAVADVPSFATSPPGRVQQLHVQPRVRPQGGLLGQGRDPGRLTVLLEVVLRVRSAFRCQVGVPADLWRFAKLAGLRLDPHESVQPDQALGLGRDRRAIRSDAPRQALGDLMVASLSALLQPFRQPPELGLSALAADVRRLCAAMGEH